MKPSITETGRLLHVDGDTAVVRMGSAQTCRGCGMAAIGLCRPGGPGTIIRAENRAGAKPGDVVTLSLDRPAKRAGYIFAYFLPAASLLAGAIFGNLLPLFAGFEVFCAFFFLALSIPYCLWKIKALERTRRMYVSKIENRDADFNLKEAGGEGLDYLRIMGN